LLQLLLLFIVALFGGRQRRLDGGVWGDCKWIYPTIIDWVGPHV
jgi:hypothetical protein